MSSSDLPYPIERTIAQIISIARTHDFLEEGSNQLQTTFAVYCIVLRVVRQRHITFFQVTDGQGEMSLGVRHDSQPTGISSLQDVSELARIKAIGKIAIFGRQADPRPGLLVDHLEINIGGGVEFDRLDHKDIVVPAIELARIRREVEDDIFRSQNYIELEATYLTHSPIHESLEPLKVVFSGRGTPSYLEPTPLPQLMYAALTSGYTRVFCSSRLFSRAHRDGFTSAESPIVSGLALFGPKREAELEELLGVLTKEVCSVVDQLLGRQDYSPGSAMPYVTHWLKHDEVDLKQVDGCTLVRRQIPDRGPHVYSLKESFEILYPNDKSMMQFAVGEGQTGEVGSDIGYLWMVLHVERIKRILGEYHHWPIERRRSPRLLR